MSMIVDGTYLPRAQGRLLDLAELLLLLLLPALDVLPRHVRAEERVPVDEERLREVRLNANSLSEAASALALAGTAFRPQAHTRTWWWMSW